MGRQRSGTQGPGEKHNGLWDMGYAKKVAELRAKVGLHLQSLTMLLQGEASQIVAQMTQKVDNTLTLVSTQTADISTATQHCQIEIGQLRTDLDRHERNISSSFHDHRILLDGMTTILTTRFPEPTIEQPRSSSTKGPGTSLTTGNLVTDSVEQDEVMTLLLRLLATITRDLKELIFKIWLCLPYFIPFLESLVITLRREPMLAISDSINFEDVLGRRYTLQFAFYQHWPKFKLFLQHQFRKVPGGTFVKSGEYFIIDSRSYRFIFTESEWKSTITPGCQLLMTTGLQDLEAKLNLCPRPGCNAKSQRDFAGLPVIARLGMLLREISFSRNQRQL
ncbi:hypothetical protein QBC43DRAFT_6404 [Cladorrhinum sp. PSN259]|nr:hypothetical protein QBC43DRAFT_6404 [Cladorrhinum sp. PSN259]